MKIDPLFLEKYISAKRVKFVEYFALISAEKLRHGFRYTHTGAQPYRLYPELFQKRIPITLTRLLF